jgi:hypothetical protein
LGMEEWRKPEVLLNTNMRGFPLCELQLKRPEIIMAMAGSRAIFFIYRIDV